MKKIRLLSAVLLMSLVGIGSLSPVFAEHRGDEALIEVTKKIKQVRENQEDARFAEGVIGYVNKILEALKPVIIAIGITIAMFGTYTIMSSDKEDKLKEGGRLVIAGVVGIIIMVSANFITSTLINDVINENIGSST
ncbi:MAG: hypothetical protein LBI53_07600 [Candidatus Peribacteria bacterium]|jgi:hypothetical protein|nr:hypothetical protein [Candidatus Peribacteria bacterium]